MKAPIRKRRTIQDDPRFDDSGFSEESSQDEFIYNRSNKINPTQGKPSPKGEIPIPGILARRLRPIRQRGT